MERALGFRPWEVSSAVNDGIVVRHADEAAFLWTLRSRAVGEPHYTLNDLARLDERVEAHLDGLRVGGDAAWRHCTENLSRLGAGEVFALSVLAFSSGNRERMRDALLAGCVSPDVRRGLVSALAWIGEAATPWLQLLSGAKLPEHRLVGFAALALRGEDAGAALRPAIGDADPSLRARAMRAAGELKRLDLVGAVRVGLTDLQLSCRFWAAWALTLLGDAEGWPALLRFIDEESFALRALQLGLRAAPLQHSLAVASALAARPDRMRLAIVAAGVVGDPQSVPWLIARMDDPATARLAGEAFSTMTGLDLVFQDLNLDAGPPLDAAPADAGDLLPPDYEANLPLPALEKVQDWWRRQGAALSPGKRHLAGRAITAESMVQVLVRGRQRQRAAAALELALARRDAPLFEVRAHAQAQRQRLGSWTS